MLRFVSDPLAEEPKMARSLAMLLGKEGRKTYTSRRGKQDSEKRVEESLGQDLPALFCIASHSSKLKRVVQGTALAFSLP